MALSKESIRKLKAVKAAILAEPELYDQRVFPSMFYRSTCQTPCCIEGWAAWVNTPDPVEYEKRLREVKSFSISKELGISGEEGARLFSEWPKQFSDAWEKPGTVQAAVAGGKRIDLFIATDGRE